LSTIEPPYIVVTLLGPFQLGLASPRFDRVREMLKLVFIACELSVDYYNLPVAFSQRNYSSRKPLFLLEPRGIKIKRFAANPTEVLRKNTKRIHPNSPKVQKVAGSNVPLRHKKR
jgi:hypothetical protein